jgi:hypothetical protein
MQCPELNNDGSFKTPNNGPQNNAGGDVQAHDSIWTAVATVVASIAVMVAVLLFM